MVLVHVRMKTKTALVRTSDVRVLRTKSDELEQFPFVVLCDDLDLHHPRWGQKNLPDLIAQIEDVRGLVKIVMTFFEHG